ncbi:MAG TPA: ferritin-like domain-containing protein [Terriglobales bacterium]|nr:ferritin-like domain-containing protein [Terriglobales bacterium]
MKEFKATPTLQSNRRSFLKNGVLAAGVAAAGAGLLTNASARDRDERERSLSKGDAAILQLLLAAEIIETDLWQQYNELGGVAASNSYVAALQNLDGDMPQYISDNTDDEMSHVAFLHAYLKSKGHQPVDLSHFFNLQPSSVPGVPQTGRLTNLKQLSVDTSWWTRYRSKENPDLGATFPQAVPSLNQGQHPAIPVSAADLNDSNHIQAIANTAGFHFGFIEQAGTSLYATLSQRVSSPEVLRITISIGGSEIMHFQVWHDKAGNAVALTDNQPGGTLTFVNLADNQPESLQANLIMPEPCDFIKGLPECAIIRPTGAGQIDAAGAINGFIADGLFIGQPKQFLELLLDLANEADQAQREF